MQASGRRRRSRRRRADAASAVRLPSQRPAGITALFILLLAMLLGGGTRNDLMSDLTVQLASSVTLVWGLNRLSWAQMSVPTRHFLLLVLAVALLPLIQLLPLPTVLTHAMAGRDVLSAGRESLGLGSPMFAPWSLDPNATLAALRGLLPATALAVIGCQLNAIWLKRLSLAVVAIALMMVPLGIAQVAQGPHSELRPYVPTNVHDAVGLFANRNHYAAFLATALALVMAHLVRSGYRHLPRSTGHLIRVGWILAGAMLLLGIVLSRSRGGVGIAGLAMLVWLAVAFIRRRRDKETFYWLLGFACISGLLAFQFGFLAIADRLNQQGDIRIDVFADVMALSGRFGWLGTGLGSFQAMYAAYEPLELVGAKILTHAHNDWAELWVELGLLLIPVTLAFGYWFWKRLQGLRGRGSHHALHLGGALIVVMLCLHSLVDYPLRTTAVSTMFVLACLLLVSPLPPRQEGEPGPGISPRPPELARDRHD